MEQDPGLAQIAANLGIFLVTQLLVPARQTVLDFTERTVVLLQDDSQDPAFRTQARSLGSGHRPADDGDYVSRACRDGKFVGHARC